MCNPNKILDLNSVNFNPEKCSDNLKDFFYLNSQDFSYLLSKEAQTSLGVITKRIVI